MLFLARPARGIFGDHFPPDDLKWEGEDSSKFVTYATGLIKAMDGLIINVDITLICEAPKIKPHREAMRASVGRILGLDINRVNVKATTTEMLGFTGRREGIAAQAVATIRLPAQN